MKPVNIVQFRRKYKKLFFKRLYSNEKIHIVESNNDDDDWDNGELINGNKQLQYIHRRPCIFNIRKKWITYWFCMFSTHCKHIYCKK
jgi:hypothetical protein